MGFNPIDAFKALSTVQKVAVGGLGLVLGEKILKGFAQWLKGEKQPADMMQDPMQQMQAQQMQQQVQQQQQQVAQNVIPNMK